LDYFPHPFLMFIDESHVTVSQAGGMYRGDRARKETLVEYGFRLPSALDNRPLKEEEFLKRLDQIIYVSATPGDEELRRSGGVYVEQVVRPTGLLDPEVEVRSAKTQVDDLLGQVRKRVKRNERILATTLTKRMAEDLTDFCNENGIRVRYLHSDIDTFERVEIIRGLRKGDFDLLVGINLLREGLDIPEVSLVAILDADKEGFLRSHRSLVQTMGRAARNVHGKVILYAETVTRSMQSAMEETQRRREKQKEYNREHQITPKTVQRKMNDIIQTVYERDYVQIPMVMDEQEEYISPEDLPSKIEKLEKEMKALAKDLKFEEALVLREKIKQLRENALQF